MPEFRRRHSYFNIPFCSTHFYSSHYYGISATCIIALTQYFVFTVTFMYIILCACLNKINLKMQALLSVSDISIAMHALILFYPDKLEPTELRDLAERITNSSFDVLTHGHSQNSFSLDPTKHIRLCEMLLEPHIPRHTYILEKIKVLHQSKTPADLVNAALTEWQNISPAHTKQRLAEVLYERGYYLESLRLDARRKSIMRIQFKFASQYMHVPCMLYTGIRLRTSSQAHTHTHTHTQS